MSFLRKSYYEGNLCRTNIPTGKITRTFISTSIKPIYTVNNSYRKMLLNKRRRKKINNKQRNLPTVTLVIRVTD
jgi:hypothetical protein